jgi:hypothetical protein
MAEGKMNQATVAPIESCDCDHCRRLRRHQPQYEDLRLPDGRHTGVRVDVARGILEVQRNRIRYYFDLTTLPIAKPVQICYDNRTGDSTKVLIP